MFKYIRRIAKQSQTISQIHRWVRFIQTIPPKDFLAIERIKLIFKAMPNTQSTYQKLSALYDAACCVEAQGIHGSFVECGVRNGGSAAVMAAVAARNSKRDVWLFDSWEGLPDPTGQDITHDGQPGRRGQALGYLEQVNALLFSKMNLDPNKIHIEKGWFNETIPTVKENLAEIALLNLDCDWYESVKFCMEELYPRVVRGGVVFIDDYFYWQGARKAVDDFMRQHPQIKLTKIDAAGVCFQKQEQTPLSLAVASH
jgi:O-methyltransferase